MCASWTCVDVDMLDTEVSVWVQCVSPRECGWDMSNNYVRGCGSVCVYVCVLDTVWACQNAAQCYVHYGCGKKQQQVGITCQAILVALKPIVRLLGGFITEVNNGEGHININAEGC